MLNSDTKRHIDKARDVLVGVAPSPMTQVDLITTALIYKFMDDMDQQSIKAGGKPSFFIGDIEKYSWNKLIDPKLDNQGKVNLYQEALTKLPEASNLPSLFREIFKDTFLPFRNVNTFKLFIDEIDYFDYSHPEELGNAFEYLLTILGVSGDAGMFRTPRHIIDFIVKVVDPNKDDRILDPACGTAGFLIQAYKHIISKHDGLNDPEGKEETLTTEEIKNLTNNIEGYDISPEMVKLSSVNLYLHDFKNPKISEYDTLSSDEKWNERFDVILANPPFMTPRGGIIPHNRFSIQATKSEVLFVDYILTHLKHSGRAGIVVPEGIIFQSGNAYKELRKKLLNEGLFGVVSLPSGVFNPYSGVKTSILLIDKELAKSKNEVLFIKISNDGFDLGAQRREINKNDLPIALEILNKWKTAEKIENSIGTYIEKSKIAQSEDYNLSGDRFKIKTEYTEFIWPVVKLENLCNITTGKKDVNEGNPHGRYPFFTCAKENTFIDTFSFDTEALLIAGNGDVGAVKYYKGKFEAYQRTYVLNNFTNVNARYLYYVLSNTLKENMQLQKLGNTMPYIKLGMLQEFLIPLPPLEIQEQIVEELDRYQKIIEGAKLITENWKPIIEIDTKWEKVNLPKISNNLDNKRKPITKSDRLSGKYPYYGASGIVDYVDDYIFEGNFLLISEDGANLLTRTTNIAFSITGKNWVNNHAHVLKFNNIETQKYVQTYFNQIDIREFVTGSAQPKLNQQSLNSINIPLPNIEAQKQIVEKIENEKKLVDSSKELIEIYKKKIKEKIESLWRK